MIVSDRRRLQRAPRSGDSEPRYWHPNGWVIMRETRDCDAPGLGLPADPKVMWAVKRKAPSDRRREYFNTLGLARIWCDEHKDWPDA